LLRAAFVGGIGDHACSRTGTGCGLCLRQLHYGDPELPDPCLDHLPDGQGREQDPAGRGEEACRGSAGSASCRCPAADRDPRPAQDALTRPSLKSIPASPIVMRSGGLVRYECALNRRVIMSLLNSLSPRALAAPESGIVEVITYARGQEGLIPLWAGEGDLPSPDFINRAASEALLAGETFY